VELCQGDVAPGQVERAWIQVRLDQLAEQRLVDVRSEHSWGQCYDFVNIFVIVCRIIPITVVYAGKDYENIGFEDYRPFFCRKLVKILGK
jgi:hypothetical protein